LIKAGAFKIKAKINNDFYKLGKSPIFGENWHRKIGSFYPKVVLVAAAKL
jgi:hypothetical protein